MTSIWHEEIDDLGLSRDPADPPLDESGVWFQALAEFRKLGFARLLVGTEPAALALHAGHPEITAELVEKASHELENRAGCLWTLEEVDSTWWLISDEIDPDHRRAALVTLLRLAEDLRDDQPEWEWLFGASYDDETQTPVDEERDEDESTERSGEEETPKVSEDDHSEDEDSEDESAEETRRSDSGSPFETIGTGSSEDDGKAATPAEAPESAESGREFPAGFSFLVEPEEEYVVVALAFEDAISELRSEIEDAISRNLRAKFDVEVTALGVEDARPYGGPFRRMAAFRLIPTSLTGDKAPSIEECEQAVGEYLETIESLADGGIEPLVFLGIKNSSKSSSTALQKETESGIDEDSSPRESTGDDEYKEDASAADDQDEVFFLIADDELEEDDKDSVVLASSEIADDDPLEEGRFDDPRLDEKDATTALVDVVLRHPGYSDKRVGQVLSILFSIEYYEALRLMNAAPIVIARGVSSERGHTIQNVVEGAGGRVKLAEPDRFPISD